MRRHKIQFEGLESEAFDEGLGGIWSYTDGAKLVLRQYPIQADRTWLCQRGKSSWASSVMVGVKLSSRPRAARSFIQKSMMEPPPQPAQQCQ